MKKILIATILALSAGLLSLPTLSVTAQDNTAVSVSSPSEGEIVVGHNAEFNGKGPKNTLITVEITDTDTTRPIIEHQEFGHVTGSTTSDADGDWVFVPQEELVPGKFSIHASYKAQDQTVKSEEVSFTVVDDGGSSGRLSSLAARRLIIGAGVLALVVLTCVVLLVRRNRRRRTDNMTPATSRSFASDAGEHPDMTTTDKKPSDPLFLRTDEGKQFVEQESRRLSTLDAEAVKIEEDLAQAAQQLERTNAEVAQLRKQLAGQEPPPDNPPSNLKSKKTKK